METSASTLSLTAFLGSPSASGGVDFAATLQSVLHEPGRCAVGVAPPNFHGHHFSHIGRVLATGMLFVVSQTVSDTTFVAAGR